VVFFSWSGGDDGSWGLVIALDSTAFFSAVCTAPRVEMSNSLKGRGNV
jgi:hypothetical protein